MSTSTPRLGLVKPAVGEQYNVATENTNKDTIDTFVSGTADKFAKGRIGYNSNDASNVITSSAQMFDLVAVDLVNGRSYTVTYAFNADDGAGSFANLAFSIQLKKSIVSDTGTSGTQIDSTWTAWTAALVDSGKRDMATFTFEAAATETVNLKIIVTRAGSADVVCGGRRLSVYDVGAWV